jgi:hypothetical protein
MARITREEVEMMAKRGESLAGADLSGLNVSRAHLAGTILHNTRLEPDEYACGICGFVMNETEECPRCKIQNEGGGNALHERERGQRGLWDDLYALFDGRLSNDD